MDETILKGLMKDGLIGFGTVFKVCRKIKLFKYEYDHIFMLLDIYDDSFTVGHVSFNVFRGAIFEKRVVYFKDGDHSLFDFPCGVYFEESYVLNKTDREAIRSRVEHLQSLCIHYGFGQNRWNCESAINYVKYGNKILLDRTGAAIFQDRFFITGPFILYSAERLATGVYIIARISNFCKKIKKVKSHNFRNCIRDTVCKVPVIVTPGLFLPRCQQANSNVSNYRSSYTTASGLIQDGTRPLASVKDKNNIGRK